MPGTPPAGVFGSLVTVSHTAGLPLPRLRLACICKSGRSSGFAARDRLPGGKPLEPARDSTTRWNPNPAKRSKIGMPSGLKEVGISGKLSAVVNPKKVMFGPGASVGVIVGVRDAVGVEVIVGVGVDVRVNVGVLLIVAVAVTVRVRVAVCVGVDVRVDDGVRVRVSVRVAVDVCVPVAVRVRV